MPLGRIREVKDLQFWNVQAPISITLPGMVMEAREEQPAKA